jgi:hypothetical protein
MDKNFKFDYENNKNRMLQSHVINMMKVYNSGNNINNQHNVSEEEFREKPMSMNLN